MSQKNKEGVRAERLADDIHAFLSRTLRQDVKDPRVADVSITAVRLSRDLSIAHVNLVPLGGQGDAARILEGLEAASGYLRRELGRQIRVRHVPELRFHLDEGLDASLRMTSMLVDMERTRGGAGGAEPEGEA